MQSRIRIILIITLDMFISRSRSVYTRHTFRWMHNKSLIKAIETTQMLVSYRPVGPFQMNQYLLTCKKTNEAAIIDSGENPDVCFGASIAEGKFDLKHLIQTHAHIDHVSGLKSMSMKYPDATIYLHDAELPLYESVDEQVRMFGVDCDLPLPAVNRLVQDGEVVSVGKIDLKVLFAPGHSPGGCVYFYDNEEQPFAFVGDLIFQGSVGRTDLPLSSQKAMKESLRKIVAALPKKTILLPGHNDITTMDDEIKYNPFIRQWTV